ncbi:hypothetical protein ACFFLM_05635 [Deinococcus oregonensis]|uniref:DUF308 domain-containing protein n=1 Tax=Deinococcus oregonensis TaxID=1805970 RepID=A0ABV6AVH4_9DEIO
MPHAQENVQVVARSILAVCLGLALVIFAPSPRVTVVSGVTWMLIADGALGLWFDRRVARAGQDDDSWSTGLRPLWSFNLGMGLMMLLAITLNRPALAAGVIAVATAITTGMWWVTRLHSEARLQRALLIWAALLFLSAAALPVVWTLQLTPLDAWSPRILGALKVFLGLLMLLVLHRSRPQT